MNERRPTMGGMGKTSRAVLVEILAMRAEGVSNPSIRLISERLDLDRERVSRAAKVLVNRGILTVTTVVDTVHVTDPYGNLAEAVERRLADGSDRPTV